ncbi:MAG: hypothetical protein ABI273_13930 [Lacunisphaera sp.]
MTTVESAQNYGELLGASVAASPYEYGTLFQADGFMGRQRSKKRLRLLKRIDFKLRHILERGEKVHFVTTGTTVSGGGNFLFALPPYYLNRQALVFTSRRILLLQINARNRPQELISQLPYASIAGVKPSWNGGCAVKLLNRETLNFQHIPSADQKYLIEFLADIVQLTNAPFEQKRGVEQLCPHCFVFVPDYPASCPSCTGKFKSAGKAALLSAIFPGLGGFYLGYRWFALLELLGAGALWRFLVIEPLLDQSTPRTSPGFWMMSAAIIVAVHTIDAMMSYHFARKGHYPSGVAPLPASLPPYVDRPKPDANPVNKLKINRTAPPV